MTDGQEDPASGVQQDIRAARDSLTAGRDLIVNNYLAGDTENTRQSTDDLVRHDLAPFLIVDRSYLDQERQKLKEPYIAHPPTWADVVHGANTDTRFLKRDQYESLLSEINRLLLGPIRRGSDRRLPTLFVTGAPGCGKSTLVRHAAATLIDRGEVLVTDLGVNHGSLSVDDLDLYIQSLASLSRSGPPILLLMDDPFFANSGWEILLERLGRPNYSNIAVLGASPTYLYDTYARRISGRQVVLNRFDLHPTSLRERVTFAQMYGVTADAVLNNREDLLVFAMETVTGQHFDEIIERIWSTLNDGLAIARRTRLEDLQWPVMAFLFTCYMHRHYVMCPESLLRAALISLLRRDETDYVSELSELTFNEGWYIFRISWQAASERPTALIGTMHARVAERAWQLRPMRTIDTAERLINASINAPECVPQLAEFILACQSTIDPDDRRFVQKVAELWDNSRISTAQLSALVRGIRNSPQASILFRKSLRERLRRRDSESWLAAVELINMGRRGSPDRMHLEQVKLPACLKRANLAAGSAAAIEILSKRNNPSQRRAFIDTLRASLEGQLTWQLDGTLLIWLLRNDQAMKLHPSIPKIYEWIESHPEEIQPRADLMRWYRNRVTVVDYTELRFLWDQIQQWAIISRANRKIVLTAFSLVRAMIKSNVLVPDNYFYEMASWLNLRPEDIHLRYHFLSLIMQARDRSAVMAKMVEETRAWLHEHPDDVGDRRQLLTLVRVMPDGPAGEVVEETRAWLREHPDNIHVRKTLLALVRVMPDSPAGEMVKETRAWLREHRDDVEVRRTLLALVQGMPDSPAGEVVEETRAWLREHPDDVDVRRTLLALVQGMPDGPAGEMVKETRAWLREHPDDVEVRKTLLALVQGMPDGPAGEMVKETRAWLREHPDDVEVRKTLLALVQGMPDGPAGEVVEETRAWQREHPDDVEVRRTLLALVRVMPDGPAGEVVEETRAWLREHPDDVEVRKTLLALVQGMPDGPAGEMVKETRAWLREHPDDVDVRTALLALVQAVPDSPVDFPTTSSHQRDQ